MRIVTEVKIQKDGTTRIDPSIWEKMGLLGKKARCIFTGDEVILMPLGMDGNASLLSFMKGSLHHKVSHKQAQRALSSIKGSLAQAVIDDRRDRD